MKTDEIGITVYGTVWCPDTLRARRVLDRMGVRYRWVDIDRDADGESFVLQANRGNRSVPTIVFPDGSMLVEPIARALKEKLVGSGYSR